MYNSIHQFEPLLPQVKTGELEIKAARIVQSALRLTSIAHPTARVAVRELVLLERLREVLANRPVTETELRGLIDQADGLVRTLGAHMGGSERRLTELAADPDSSLAEIAIELHRVEPWQLRNPRRIARCPPDFIAAFCQQLRHGESDAGTRTGKEYAFHPSYDCPANL